MKGIFLRPLCGLLMCLLSFQVVSGQGAFGKTLTVPSSYPTVQSAINAAVNGDEIIVSPGKYVETIRISGKNIILRSTSPGNAGVVATTIIDGNSSSSVVLFAGTEASSCVLSGFTLTRGRASMGGGINGAGTRATISNNRITTNTASGGLGNGGGIHNCDGLIENNTIVANTAAAWGGGLHGCDGTIGQNTVQANRAQMGAGFAVCNATITGNTIRDNQSLLGQGAGLFRCNGLIAQNQIVGNRARYGGGLFDCEGTLRGNRITTNRAAEVGGGVLSFAGTIEKNVITTNTASFWGGGIADASGTVKNNLIFDNFAGESGGAIYLSPASIHNNTIFRNRTSESTALSKGAGGLANCSGQIKNNIIWANFSLSPNSQLSSSSLPTYCCIQNWTGGGQGNITTDPKLANPATGNHHLQASSPCVDAGGNIAGITEDYEGDARPFKFATLTRGDGSGFDIGADELVLKITRASIWTMY